MLKSHDPENTGLIETDMFHKVMRLFNLNSYLNPMDLKALIRVSNKTGKQVIEYKEAITTI